MVLGITGISGSGKNEAARFYEQRRWKVIDVDELAHLLYRPYTHVWKEVVEEFGEGILTKSDIIDRVKLSKIVFNPEDPEGSRKALKKLDAIMHPALIRHIKEVIHRHYRRQTDIVVVAALHQQLEMKEYCDKIMLIQADPQVCRARAIKKDGIPPEVYDMRVALQREPKNPDFIVQNNSTIEAMFKYLNVLDLHKES